MAKIEIEWLRDRHECETCGSSYAEGARVYIDGGAQIDLPPHAHCFGGDDYQERDVFGKLLEHLGHTVSDKTT